MKREKRDSLKTKAEQDNEAKCCSTKPSKKKNGLEQNELYLKNDLLFFKSDFMCAIKRILSIHLTWITPINGLGVDFCL